MGGWWSSVIRTRGYFDHVATSTNRNFQLFMRPEPCDFSFFTFLDIELFPPGVHLKSVYLHLEAAATISLTQTVLGPRLHAVDDIENGSDLQSVFIPSNLPRSYLYLILLNSYQVSSSLSMAACRINYHLFLHRTHRRRYIGMQRN